MKKLSLKVWIALLTLMLVCGGAQAYTVVGNDGEPFYYKDGSQGITGACRDLLAEFCDQQKVSCKFKMAPIPKILEMLKNGEADISCPLGLSPERREFIHFSEKLFRTHYSFFATTEVAKKIAKMEDLENFSVSVLAPSRMSQVLQSMNDRLGDIFKIVPEGTEMNSLLKAEKVAKTLAFANSDIAKRWIEKSKSPLMELPVGREEIFYYIAFSKKTISQEIMTKLLAGLGELRTAKRLEKIAEKYKLQAAETLTAESVPKTQSSPP